MDSDPPLSRASRRDFIIAFLGDQSPRTPNGISDRCFVAML